VVGLLPLRLCDREEQVEAGAERLLLVLGFRQGQQQRVAQDGSLGKADLLDRAHRIDTLGRRDMHARAARGTKEAMQVLAHTSGPMLTFAHQWGGTFANVSIKGPLAILDSSG